MIDRYTIDRINAAANIVEIVSDFVTLRKKGVNYQACCPFHSEKTPSFVVSPSKGLFKCFGCGKGGNAVTFVMEHESMTYVEAMKYIAKKYGIDVVEKEASPEEQQRNDDRESMMVVSSYAGDWFHKELTGSEEGRNIGLSYFRERGFSDVIIEKFRLGYCPAYGDVFSKAATAAGYKEQFLTATGLTIVRDNGTYYDRFAGRVIFPIHSISGRTIAFGGRTMRTDKNAAKYLNSPESEIYHKSNVLYGLFQAKRAVTQEDCCILVEGYTDVLSMHQSGIENVVASSGTSLTEGQIQLIARFTRNVTVIYDGDPAGIKASLRGIDMILGAGLNVHVVLLPDGDDPDSFARKNNATQLQEYITQHSEDFMAFKIRVLMSDTNGDPIKKAAVITDIVQSISVIPEPIARNVYIKECASLLDVDYQVLVNEVARKRISHTGDKETREFVQRQQSLIQQPTMEQLQARVRRTPPGSSIEELEKELVRYLLRYGEMNFDYKEGREMVSLNVAEIIISDLATNGITLTTPKYAAIYNRYAELYEQGGEIGMHHFINDPDPEISNAVVDILTSEENYSISKLWKKHEIIVEGEENKLSTDVPRIIILYKSKAIERIIGELKKKLNDENIDEEEQSKILFRISALNKEKVSIANKLSRLIL